MRFTLYLALLGISARVLDKDSVKAGWDDPPVLVLLLRPSIHRIYYCHIPSIPGLCEFDHVEYWNTTERNQSVLGMPTQCISSDPRVIRLSNEIR